MLNPKLIQQFRVAPGSQVNLKDYATAWPASDHAREFGEDFVKERAKEILKESRKQLDAAQELLYASDSHSLLLIFQGLDAAGKDGTIRHVMSGVNPQGCQVFSFKRPSVEELDHNFLWRYMKALPELGRIGIFNRSYYEDVLVVKIHPEWLGQGQPAKPDARFWEQRYEDINNFEKHLTRNNTLVLKFCLHLSKDEQKKRFLERLTQPQKYWKFSDADLAEREHWKDYQKAFEETLSATSTKRAPWYVIPADRKYITRALVANIIATAIHDLNLDFPKVSPEKLELIATARAQLEKKPKGDGTTQSPPE